MPFNTPKKVDLWSWLVMRQNRSEYHCPPGLNVTTEEFCDELTDALLDNDLPAKAALVDVDWDKSGTVQRRAMVTYTGKEKSRDILQVLVGVDQVGRFAYVETKTCIRPPDLPVEPRKPKNDDEWGLGCMVGIGFVILVAFIVLADGQGVGIVMLLVGLGLAYWLIRERNNIASWNESAKRERQAWDAAWNTWVEQRLNMAYLSRTDDIYGRFGDAVMSTVNQTAKKLLIDRQAELRKEVEEQQDLKEMQAEMEKRRKQALD